MVDLVLEHATHEFVGLDLDLVTLDGEAAHQHLIGAQQLDVQLGDAEAALVVDPLSVALDDDRVDDGHRLVVDVPHHDLLLHTDLWRRQRDARARVVERVEHVVDETRHLAVDLGDGGGLGLQHGVAEGADLAGHVCKAIDA